MNLAYELNYTFRVLKQKMGFSFLCVLVIALGYVIALPMYSVVKNMAYATLSIPDGDRLVIVLQTEPRSGSNAAVENFDNFLFNAVKERSSSFEQLGAYVDSSINLSDGEISEQYYSSSITSESLAIANTNPVLGRLLLPEDEALGAEPVVLISHQLWQGYYAGDPNIIGRIARVNAEQTTIIGVMPPGFKYPFNAELWLPLSIPAVSEPGSEPNLVLTGVLKEGVSIEEASAELALIMQNVASDEPEFYEFRSAKAIKFTHSIISNGVWLIDVMAGIALCLYLVICFNVGNLLIIRANERVGELAIRSAVGAKRFSLVSHVLLESFLVCLCGAVIGMLISVWLLGLIEAYFFNAFLNGRLAAFWWDFGFNLDVLNMSAGMMLVIWLVAGVFAAWRVSRGDVSTVLGSDSRSVVAAKGGRVTRALVQVQMLLSFFLLILSGVFLFSFQGLILSSPVVDADNYVIASITLSDSDFEQGGRGGLYSEQLEQELLTLGEFDGITFATALPGTVVPPVPVSFEGDGQLAEDAPALEVKYIAPDYFQTIQFLLLEGRAFDGGDIAGSNGVAIVDDKFVSTMSMQGSPLGRRLQLHDSNGNPGDQLTVVGVAPSSNDPRTTKNIPGGPSIYRPMSQAASIAEFALIARLKPGTGTSLADLERSVRVAASAIDRDIPLSLFLRLSTLLERNADSVRILMAMFAAAAVGSLLLAVISIYGLISRSVYARSAEIGIRRAVGSPDRAISKLFLHQGIFYLLVAIAIGGGAAVLVVNVINSSMATLATPFNFLELLSVVFPTVTVIVSVLVFCASYYPVRKIVAMEPGEALHYE